VSSTPKERPILFSGPMVNAILKGRKTQTRRLLKGSANAYCSHCGESLGVCDRGNPVVRAFKPCPYGEPGDRLWVREKWASLSDATPETAKDPGADALASRGFYAADYFPDEQANVVRRWRPSIHMPRFMSRIMLEVTSVRVERVRDISDADAIAEGFNHGFVELKTGGEFWTASQHFLNTFFHINKRASADSNPWVRVITFKRLESK
jgi:hypothetical protein